MKLQLLFALLLLLPVVMAEDNAFEEGILVTEYPETAQPGEEVTVKFNLNLESNGIAKFEIPPARVVFDCEAMTCEDSYTFTMPDVPFTIFAVLELTNPKTENDKFYDEEADYLWSEISSGDTTIYVKRFTVLPAVPQIEVVESTPFLDDEIVDEVNRVTERVLSREQYDLEKENGKNLLITKNVEYKNVDTAEGKKVRSLWTIRIEPNDIKSAKGVYVYEEVPKKGAFTVDEIVSASHKFTVLRRDPLIMWHFEEIEEPVEITYETNKASITGAATVVTAEEVNKGTIWHIILPIFLIPVIGFLLIYFGKYKKKD